MLLSKHFNPLQTCEIKTVGERTFTGYASVWGSVDSYGDTVAQGAFAKSLESNPQPHMYFGHRSDMLPLGKWVDIHEDERGLSVTGELTPGRKFADEVYASLKHGTIGGLSIGFYDRGSKQLEDGGRLLQEIELVEVSVVNEPAERLARITSVKSAIDAFESLRDCELFLRDAGLSRAEATAFVSRFRVLVQSESEAELQAKFNAQRRLDENTRRAIELIRRYGSFTQ